MFWRIFGEPWMRRSMSNLLKPSSRCRNSSTAAIQPGTWLVGCISILRRTGGTKRLHSRFLRLIRHDCPLRPRRSICLLAGPCKRQHLPLGGALQEYAGARNRERLLSLLLPVQRAAEHCPWLKALVAAGELFHPLR